MSFTGFVAVAHFDFLAAFGGVEFEAGRSQFLTQFWPLSVDLPCFLG